MPHSYILTIDSGGVRGVIPALLLNALEQQTGKHPRELFSMVAGTSTGAILAALVAAGVPTRDIVNLYLNRAGEVFTQQPLRTLKRIIRGYMYETEHLYEVLRNEMGASSNLTLNEARNSYQIDLLLTAKAVADGHPWYFVPDNERNSKFTGRLKIADCATASAAAPTFFRPWKLKEAPPTPKPIGELVDGAVGVTGNPVYQAAVEAFYYNAYEPTDTTIISLGTGRWAQRTVPSWIVPWFSWLLNELLISPGEQQTELVARHFAHTPFFRLDPDLATLDSQLKTPVGLDDIRALPILARAGSAFAARVDWHAILNGTDDMFRITSQNTQPSQYSVPKTNGTANGKRMTKR